ncbi:hypothetical protein ABD68_10635 [Bacillus endophyticus]|nr:pre-toxin TG domain-containing protein [Priestia endophytica]MBG9812056.1 hypothetical protein [Priestia endophytica]
MEEFDTIVDIKANFKDLEQLAQKTMQAKSKIDVIPGQLSYSLSGALSELSGVWTGELEALQQELESDIRKYSEGLGETVQHIQKTAQGLKEMDMVMNAILMPSNIVLHSLSKFGFDVTSKRFISYQGRITPATGQLMARYKKGELYSYDTLFPKSKNVKVKAKNNYEAEILEAVKNHKVPSPDALRSGMGLAQDENIKDPMERQFIDTNLTNGQVASLVADFVPFLGGIKAADEARTGKQYFTGKKLDTADRAIAGASVLGGGFIKWTGKGAKAVIKGKPLNEQTHLKWNKKTGEVTQHTPKKTKGRIKNISHPVLDNTRTGSALKEPDGQHGFNDIIDNYTPHAKEFEIVGGDGVKRKLYQIEGGMKSYHYKEVYNKDLKIDEGITTVKDQNGIFEWIVDPNTGVTHRRFIPNGQITGYSNQRPQG